MEDRNGEVLARFTRIEQWTPNEFRQEVTFMNRELPLISALADLHLSQPPYPVPTKQHQLQEREAK